MRNTHTILVGIPTRTHQLGDAGDEGIIILKWVLKLWAGSKWLWVKQSCALF
jgi:hypothetical protein